MKQWNAAVGINKKKLRAGCGHLRGAGVYHCRRGAPSEGCHALCPSVRLYKQGVRSRGAAAVLRLTCAPGSVAGGAAGV